MTIHLLLSYYQTFLKQAGFSIIMSFVLICLEKEYAMLVLLVLQVLIVYTFSFVYNDGVRERCLLSCHEHGTKKKFLVHMRN